MKTLFDPDDEQAFYRTRDDLVARFERTPAGKGQGWVAAGVMDFKWGYLDGDLAHWTPDDIAEILLGLYPAKAILEPADLDAIPTAFGGFLRFLTHAGIVTSLDSSGAVELIEHIRPHFHAAALDESNWSTGKRLMVAARADGVEMDDQAALEQFMQEFNSRPFEERDAILGPATVPPVGIGPLPPVSFPPLEELEAAALASVWPERVRQLVEFVGDGRPLTDTGKLKLVDGKALIVILETNDEFDPWFGDRQCKTRTTEHLREVHLTFLTALEFGALEQRGPKVVPGPNVGELDDVLESYLGIWQAFFRDTGPTRVGYRKDRYGFGWYADELDRSIFAILLEIYQRGQMTMSEAAAGMWEHLLDTFDLGNLSDDRLEMQSESVGRALRRVFDRLEEFGTVVIDGVVEIPSKYGRTPDRSGGVMALTPLGHWVVQRIASQFTSAPVVGEMQEASVGELLAGAADLPEAEAVAEIDVWVNRHGDEATSALVEALRSEGEIGRGLAFAALLRIGPDAGEAIAALDGDSDLDQFVTIWKVDTMTGTTNDMDCGGDADRFVRLLGAVIEQWGADAAVSAWTGPASRTGGLPAMLDAAWRIERPETEGVLAAIGTSHPDKQIAKAARKALFKHRSVS